MNLKKFNRKDGNLQLKMFALFGTIQNNAPVQKN